RAKAIETGMAQLRVASPGAELTASPLTGSIEVVKNDRRALTPPAPGRAGLRIVLDFIRSHPDVYGLTSADLNGLHCLGESTSRVTGIRMIRIEQRVNGFAVFQSDTRFVLDRDGRLIRSVGLLVPNAMAGVVAGSPDIGADDALAAAMRSVGIELDQSRFQLE